MIDLSHIRYAPLRRRYHRTLEFMSETTSGDESIVDIGAPNPFSEILSEVGYSVQNTDFDLDREPGKMSDYKADIATSFEVFEHLLNPLSVLENIKAERLFTSIPMRLWFSPAYRNPKDKWDNHFHEFEDWQFEWLLEHAGWNIIRKDKWSSPVKAIGLRPLLRKFTPRYFIVEARR